ncbi:MAG: serine/threonine-protein kinase [Kofleriaceae bacterium]
MPEGGRDAEAELRQFTEGSADASRRAAATTAASRDRLPLDVEASAERREDDGTTAASRDRLPFELEASAGAQDSVIDSFLREAARVTDAADAVEGALDAARRPLAVGESLAEGRFELREVLGRGGMGVVYAARDHARGGEVALKTLRAASAAALERLRAEFLVLHDLSHPNLVALAELGVDDGRWFFTMELVRGCDFLRYVRPGGVLDEARLRSAAAQLTTALTFLHAAGKVHRDLKPSNVLVEGDRVVLLDFGLAEAVEAPEPAGGLAGELARSRSTGASDATGADGGPAGELARSRSTGASDATGAADGGAVEAIAAARGPRVLGGTLPYMAPEQAEGRVSPAADWYALGVMLWEALTGELPYSQGAAELQQAKRRGPPPLPSSVSSPLGELALRLLRPDAAARPTGAALAAALGATVATGPPRAAFVGRVEELAALTAAFTAAAERSRAVLVRGPSGIGKSALVAAFAAALRERGAPVLSDRCYERVAVPFKGLHGVAAELVAHVSAPAAEALEPAELALLTASLPALAALRNKRRGAATGPAAVGARAAIADPAERRARMFGAFARLIGDVAASTPLALIIEDVQWADRDGLALLGQLLVQVRRGALIVTTTSDAEAVEPSWAQGAELLDVGPLPPRDAEALGRALLGAAVEARPSGRDAAGAAIVAPTARRDRLDVEGAARAAPGEGTRARDAEAGAAGGAPPGRDRRDGVGGGVEGAARGVASAVHNQPADGEAAVAALLAEAAGHPLHLAELVAHRRRGGAGGIRLEAALAARVAELPASATRLLALIALAGAPLPQDVLGQAAALDGAEWWAVLGALRAAHLVRGTGGVGEARVEASHDRVRVAMQGALDADARRAAHARLAEVLERHAWAQRRPELIADHLEACDAPERAARYVDAAARQATEALAFDRAAELWRRALRLHRAATPAERADYQRRLGQVCADGGRGAAAAAAFLEVAEAEPPDALELRRAAAEQLLRSGRFEEGIALLDEVLAVVELPVLSARRWPVLSLLWERARLWGRRRLGAATEAGPAPAQAAQLAACWSAVVGASLVSPLRGAEFQARHLRLALRAGDERRVALGLAFEAGGAAIVGPPAARAHALLEEAARRIARAPEPLLHAYLELARGSVAFLTGDWPESLLRCDAAERRMREECVGAAWEMGTAQRMSLAALWHLGRIVELRQRAGEALREAARREDLYAVVQLKTVVSPVLCLMDDRAREADAELDEAEAGLPRRGVTLQSWQLMQGRALVELYRGEPEAAVVRLDRERPALRRGFLFRVHAVRVFTAYVEAAALLAAASAGGPRARELQRRAAAVAARLAGRGGNAEAAALLAAELAHLEGDEDAAVAHYRQAIEGFARREMALIAHSARWRLGRLLAGDEGRALCDGAEAALRAQGVRAPEHVIALFVPVGGRAGGR